MNKTRRFKEQVRMYNCKHHTLSVCYNGLVYGWENPLSSFIRCQESGETDAC